MLSLGNDELYWVATPELANRCASSEGFIPLLTYARSAQLHEMSRLQITRHPQPYRLRQVFEATVFEALKPMVASGQGVARMPHSMVALQIERGERPTGPFHRTAHRQPDHLHLRRPGLEHPVRDLGRLRHRTRRSAGGLAVGD